VPEPFQPPDYGEIGLSLLPGTRAFRETRSRDAVERAVCTCRPLIALWHSRSSALLRRISPVVYLSILRLGRSHEPLSTSDERL